MKAVKRQVYRFSCSREHCPSHKHLEDPLDGVSEGLEVLDGLGAEAPAGAGAAV